MKLLSMISLSMLVYLTAGCTTIPVSITYKVVDADTELPLEGAVVDAGWADVSGGEASGTTDESGMVTFMTRRSGNLGVDVRAEGYYSAWGRIWKGPLTQLPPSTFTIPLKRIINPVAMVHHRIETELPLLNEPVGFDLMVGDWVAPHGKGERADVFFRGSRRIDGNLDFEGNLRISFPGERNGIQEFFAPNPKTGLELSSAFVAPHTAPIDGYNEELNYSIFVKSSDQRFYSDENRHYLFRVRTVLENREIAEAIYGWIYGEIIWEVKGYSKTLPLRFEYYLNPDPAPDARSLEPASLSAGR